MQREPKPVTEKTIRMIHISYDTDVSSFDIPQNNDLLSATGLHIINDAL